MLQTARNETDSAGGSLHSKRYLIIDRDTKYSDQFRRLIRHNGTKVIRLPPRSPNLNAYAERFVRSIKDECLDRMIFIGQASLRRAVSEYMGHYHTERNHQGLNNRLIVPATTQATRGTVHRHARLGGTLNFYYRKAALRVRSKFWTARPRHKRNARMSRYIPPAMRNATYSAGTALSRTCNPSSAPVANTTAPTPMPSAAPNPSARELATAVRATIMKLGPGLIAPSVTAPAILTIDHVSSMRALPRVSLPIVDGNVPGLFLHAREPLP
jgi:hypothetical protein